MLYVTTRSNDAPQTAHIALMESRGADGGLYLPLRLPAFSEDEVRALRDKSFSGVVAEILNLFFASHLTSWDVEFLIGRRPVRLVPMSHRILIAETWHNPDWDFMRIVRELTTHLTGDPDSAPSGWAVMAVRIAVLFGMFSGLTEESEDGGVPVDISVASGDFSGAMAARCARQMGLPIANIVVSCNENCAPWDLIHKGELRTGNVAFRTSAPECDHAVPENLERFIHACGGTAAVGDYLSRGAMGGVYFPDEETLANLRQGIHVSVISSKRILGAIPNIYKTTGKVLGPYSTLAWCGLMDYRAQTGENRLSLVLSDRGAMKDAETVAAAMGLQPERLAEIL